MTPCAVRNCPRPVRRVKPLGKRGVISAVRNPRKASSDTTEPSGVRDPKNSSVRVNHVPNIRAMLTLVPSAAVDPEGGANGAAADAAPILPNHMTNAMVARDRTMRPLSHKSRHRCAHLSRATSPGVLMRVVGSEGVVMDPPGTTMLSMLPRAGDETSVSHEA